MHFLPFFLILVAMSSCSVVHQNPKYAFIDGRYRSKVFGRSFSHVYVDHDEENIHVYPLRKMSTGFAIDTAHQKLVLFEEGNTVSGPSTFSFKQTSLDIDFLTIPFKYRFATKEFPRQFTSSLNGAVYLGYRSDIYHIHNLTTPLGKYERRISHLGFSFGGFTGLGATAMNPWVTNNQIAIEYDGVVWTKGVSGLIGLNNFTTGLAFGWDHLLDGNRKFWLYQNRPWIGFVFGLNLN